jgi:hypothetical protein
LGVRPAGMDDLTLGLSHGSADSSRDFDMAPFFAGYVLL